MPDYFFTNGEFHIKIADWFQQYCRNLPWRHTTNPYLIWVSEIILQQTRVAQGLDYYNRFVERFPDVVSLAEADENEVLKYWQGLGYYTRARNLHAAAQQIIRQHKGVFPQKYEQVRALKGVGEYTAAAICSFAYNQPYATLDGNVFRVLARVFGIETPINTPKAKKEFTELAQNLLNKQEPALHNQAIMEFGALQCTPASPKCENCPLQEICNAFRKKTVNILPQKLKKTTVKKRFFNYFYVKNGEFTYLKKRENEDIWKNLYEFPLIETENATDLSDLLASPVFKKMFGTGNFEIAGQPFMVKHVLTHRIICAAFYIINIGNTNLQLEGFLKVTEKNLQEYPVSRLVELFLENV